MGRCIACLRGYLDPVDRSKVSTGLWSCRRCATLQKYPLPPKLESLPPLAARLPHTDWYVESRTLGKYGLPSQGRLLQLGCGLGELLLMAKRANWDIFGTETTPAGQALEGRRELSGLDRNDVLGSQFPNSSFQLILAAQILEYSSDPRRVLSTLAQKLAPGGLLVIETHNAKSMKALPTDGPVVYLSSKALVDLCTELELETVEQGTFGAPSLPKRISLGRPLEWFRGVHQQLKAIDAGKKMELDPAPKAVSAPEKASAMQKLLERYVVSKGRGETLRVVVRRPLESPLACPVCGHRLGQKLSTESFCAACGLGRQPEAALKKADATFLDELKRPALRALREISWNFWLTRIEKVSGMGRLLDLGCADGALMGVAHNRGWEVWGVEPNADLAAMAHESIRYRILTDPGWSDRFMANSCEAAIAWDMVDAVDQPVEPMINLQRALDRNGRLLLRVANGLYHPSKASWIYRTLAKKGFAPGLFRRWIFTPAQLKQLLIQTGFEDIRIWSGPPFSDSREPLKGELFCRVLSILSFGQIKAGASLVVLARKPARSARGAVRRCRVLHLLPSIDESPLAESAMLSALSLPYNRFSVEILSSRGLRPHPLIEKIARQKGVRLRTVEGVQLLGGWMARLSAILAVRSELMRNPYDVLHTHGREAGLVGRLAALLAGASHARLVHSPDGVEEGGGFARWIDRWLAGYTDVLLGQTPNEINDQVSRGVGRFHQWVALPVISREGGEGQVSELRKALNLPREFVDDFLQYRTETMTPVLEKIYDVEKETKSS